jgi:hypothetical protein
VAKRADCIVTGMCKYIAHKTAVVIICSICQNEIPTFLNSWVTNTPVKMLCPQKNHFAYSFVKNVTCLSVSILRIGQVCCVL